MRLRLAAAAFALVMVPLASATPASAATAAPAVAPVAAAPAPAAHLNAPTAANDFSFDSFTADYYLGRDDGRNATLRTVETLVANFPNTDQNHGIERNIPTSYNEVDLRLHVVSVTDAAGRPLHYVRSDQADAGYASLRIGDASTFVHGTQTYVITYTMRNVIRSFADTNADEFYWDTNGTAWLQPFDQVTARVHLAPGLSSELTGKQACYRGIEGSTRRCTIARSGTTITATSTNLGPSENMTVAIGFNRFTFATPPLLRDSWFFTIVPWLLVGLAALAAGWALWLRTFRWRDAPGRPTIIAEYTPPKDVYPALAAELLRLRKTGLSAQIVSFAVNKIVRIREFPMEPAQRRYQLELLKDDVSSRAGPETVILTTLFGHLTIGSTVRLDRADVTLGDRLAKHRSDQQLQVRTLKFRAKPRTKRPRLIAWSSLALMVLSFAHFILGKELNADSGWTSLALVLVLALSITAWIAAIPPFRLTATGAELRDHLRGLRLYIQLAEADRIRVLQAPGTAERIDVTDRSAVIRLYEKLLPYAMIFGLEKQWIGELEQNYAVTQEPDWYAGTGNLANIAILTSVVGSGNFATTPSASSGSGSYGGGSFSGGSGGGGFSGGGGGGGGGGGW
ncbi:DUF2207 domain-containing protein [Rathayibacter soli]|uniref:DUF2207 domain-containing protein n=1 Tax=Rathayibacter soli TaxID=3144168 RepID=UPI0027E45757|nr:DUF2207 domain-containing protein [Glaciibacter superstes]